MFSPNFCSTFNLLLKNANETDIKMVAILIVWYEILMYVVYLVFILVQTRTSGIAWYEKKGQYVCILFFCHKQDVIQGQF